MPATLNHLDIEIPALGASDLLTVADLTPATIRALFGVAGSFKRDPGVFAGALAGRTAVLLFEKDSLRTKVSLEIGIAKLGGTAIYHNHMDCRIGERESVPDYGRNLERWADCIVARVYAHDVLEELAEASSVPVINALSETFHPCQGLTDLFTLQESRGTLDGASVAYVGDGNNVCHSLMLTSAMLGVSFTAISPQGYGPEPEVVELARRFASGSGADVTLTPDLGAVEGVDAVYTDAWVSMGFEAEAAQRHVAFASYQVTPELMERAGASARFMHCLPAHRGFEVASEVIDGPRSIVFDQAENRMHVQNAILLSLLAPSA